MTSPSASSSLRHTPKTLVIAPPHLVDLRAASPLVAQWLPTGALFALRHESTLLNQLLPGPAEDGLFRLFLRWRAPHAHVFRSAPLAGPGLDFARTGPASVRWLASAAAGLAAETHFRLHPRLPAWSWRIRIRNLTAAPLVVDALHAQDLGLADEAAVRNNEAYTSHYLDLLPVAHVAPASSPPAPVSLGWTILARQNQPMSRGRHPWLAFACTTGAVAFCTDGRQFFGADHRLTGEPVALREPALPSQRLQQEFALAGLQSRAVTLAPGKSVEFRFLARFVADHPAASSPADLRLLRALLDPAWDKPPAPRHHRSAGNLPAPSTPPLSLFLRAPLLHGDNLPDAALARLFPSPHRHAERATDGTLLSFFCDADTHVVTRAKEATVLRPHGHILRSGDSRWFDAAHFGSTCYAAGIFSAQSYLGHPSFARLLTVVRNALGVPRASGQRIFVQHAGRWRQLGIPSAFVMTPADARWIYRLGADTLTVRTWCHPEDPVAFLELNITAGSAKKFLISHNVVLDAAEFDHAATLTLHPADAWVAAQPAPSSLVGQRQSGVCFALAAADPASLHALAGDALLYADSTERGGPCVTFQTAPVTRFGLIQLGTHEGVSALPDAVATARAEFSRASPPLVALRVSAGTLALRSPNRAARPPAPPARLLHATDPAAARINDILPWFAHNAAIHFSAPHGLEQYGGAAWGVRDVCQGSLEWLLASGDFTAARRMLETVFAQQYAHDGGWPQWFMFPPYQSIQQAHSHGDVCFWPVKALCDYLEASNDLAFLHSSLGYTDHEKFSATGPLETLLQHCDRVVAQCESRFIPGTALVNYGDGDWDDTLQPADPKLRTHMTSAWTVGLAFHAFRQLAAICHRIGETDRADRLDALRARMRTDFAQLMPGGIVAGFGVQELSPSPVALRVSAGTSTIAPVVAHFRPLLHPTDTVTHIRYRLLPMTRSILAELFTPDEAKRHLALIAQELLYPDGARLMSEPSTYAGGLERLFKRAETAANVGREIGLQYVHAHLRYAEALAKVGDADGFWHALQVINPVALAAVVPHAAPRQANTYFSSSDADFPDRYVAAARWSELRTGAVAVNGGWRLYSSGPGMFVRIVRACLLGVRESFDEVVFDPVLPRSLDGLVAETTLAGRRVELRYRVREGTSSPRALTLNGAALPLARREPNPYRAGGFVVARSALEAALLPDANTIEIEL